MKSVIENLRETGLSIYLSKFSALDKLLKCETNTVLWAVLVGSLIDLAQTFSSVEYPGLNEIDAIVKIGEYTVLFHCVDSLDEIGPKAFPPVQLLYDIKAKKYIDRFDIYPVLRTRVVAPAGSPGPDDFWHWITEAAVLESRYQYRIESIPVYSGTGAVLSVFEQQLVLRLILTGKYPRKGLNVLLRSGFIETHWADLYKLNSIDQSKEYHPEGNAWDHTLATFEYRKTADLNLALALLLHDIGKPAAEAMEGNKFHNHAQIGANMSARFLRRLDFPSSTVDSVRYLVRNHMLPAAVHSLPVFRTEEAMSSELFPLLLELYRCDLASGFHGLDGYYTACKAYRRFLKNKKNPFRSTDGKKLVRLYVES